MPANRKKTRNSKVRRKHHKVEDNRPTHFICQTKEEYHTWSIVGKYRKKYIIFFMIT